MDTQQYIQLLQNGIGRAFVANGIAMQWVKVIQSYQTFTFVLRLQSATAKNINAVMNLGKSIEAYTNCAGVRITNESGYFFIECPALEQVILYSEQLQGEGYKIPLGCNSRKSVMGINFDHDFHALFIGITGSGKTSAVHNTLYHLLKQNPSTQLIIACEKMKDWRCLTSVATVICDHDKTLNMLKNMTVEMRRRCKLEIENPRIFIVLDDFLSLIETEGIEEELGKLMPLCRGVGIHFILTSQRMSGIDRKITGNCSAKVLFQVADLQDSHIVGGRANLHAETLGRFKGDAILLCNETQSRIACAYIEKAALRTFADGLHTEDTVSLADCDSDPETGITDDSVTALFDSAKLTETPVSKYSAKELASFHLAGKPEPEHYPLVKACLDFFGSKNKAASNIWQCEKPGSNHYKYIDMALGVA